MATYTQAQLDKLRAAYASGALVVEYEGHRTTFRSLTELSQAIDRVAAALAADTTTPPIRHYRVTTGKGV